MSPSTSGPRARSSYEFDSDRINELGDGAKEGFPAIWELCTKAKAEMIEKLRTQISQVEAMGPLEFFAEVGVFIPEEVCRRDLAELFKSLPACSEPRDGAFAQYAGVFGKPWAIRLNYGNWETHVNLNWTR